MKKSKYIYSILFFLFISSNIYTQSLPTKTFAFEDYYRRGQLLGEIGLEHSFVSYPLFPTAAFNVKNPYDPETTLSGFGKNSFDGVWEFDDGKYLFKLLPITWNNQFNSHHPEGYNDGSMIPSKGYQTIISAGFFFKYDHLTIQIQPEFVHAENSVFEGFPLTRENPEMAILRWAQYYYHTLNYIDQPEQFGDGAYNKAFWGQSSIRLTFNSISLGLSTENLWWGPGMYNSLLMTNTASGFAHFTFNTVKPIKTLIGSFEGQIIAGWLKGSGYPPPNTEVVDHNGNGFYAPKTYHGRYINGMIISYQPKWVAGLHIGLIRSFQMYHNEMGDAIGDYLPIFNSFSEKSSIAEEGDANNYKRRDQYNSVFIRFVWPESHVEIYGEFGRSSNYWDNRDLIVQAEFSTAYNLGFRKLIALNNRFDDYIQVGMELTQLAKNANTILRGARSWYASPIVRHGYTHKGQLLGAGIGPGSNLQTLNISWNRDLKSVGLQFERLVHNNDFHFENVKDIRMHWVDISATLHGNWNYKNLIFNFKLKAVTSLNYQWVFDYNWDDYWDATGADDVFNFHGQLGITYIF